MTLEEQNNLVPESTRRIHCVADFGAQAIGELRKAIETRKMDQFLTELKTEASKGSMKVCYYGYEILFCIEIEVKAQSPLHSDASQVLKFPFMAMSAKLSAYHLSYEGGPHEKPKGHLLARLEIKPSEDCTEGTFWDDELPEHRRHLGDFAEAFLVRALRSAFDNGMTLRP